MTTHVINRARSSVQTTDATQTTLATYGPATSSCSLVIAHIVAIDGSNNVRSWTLSQPIKIVSGTASVLGTLASPLATGDVGGATWAAMIDATSGNIRVRVTGAVATTINWACDLEVHEYVP